MNIPMPVLLTIVMVIVYLGWLTYNMSRERDRLTAIAIASAERDERMWLMLKAFAFVDSLQFDKINMLADEMENYELRTCACDSCARWRKEHGVVKGSASTVALDRLKAVILGVRRIVDDGVAAGDDMSVISMRVDAFTIANGFPTKPSFNSIAGDGAPQ